MKEAPVAAAERWAKLTLIQEHYADFTTFLRDGMLELGFSSTEIQEEIGDYLQHGPPSLMVQAQRSQAKTTVAALFAVWSLIHFPFVRVLILSAGGTQANEISTLIVRIIMNMDVLEVLRPDKMAGDKTSTENFDVHHTLKGLDKSPSVACVGIDSNLQGKRADILIPDDVESGKNSATAVQRAKLAHITKDFASICVGRPERGFAPRILWLGTPQTNESIYNSLPSRGVEIRIWPGRYPTPEQREWYGSKLAPGIIRRLDADPSLGTGGGILGDQGQPVDPSMATLNEESLNRKELDQGTPYFQLQHMLNTKLSDLLRYPLRPEYLIVMQTDGKRFPLSVVRGMVSSTLLDFNIADHTFKMQSPHELAKETAELQEIVAYIDPAPGGANADETAWAIGGFLNSVVWGLSVGGMPGGYEEHKLVILAKHIAKYKPHRVVIEKNMGHGAFKAVFQPIMNRYWKCNIEDDLVTGQKEKRIINTLAPVMGRGSLVMLRSVVDEDMETIERYSVQMRQSYSLFYQLAKMTMVSGALVHDDRADALEGLVRQFAERLALDHKKELERLAKKQHEEMVKDPLGHNRYKTTINMHGSSPYMNLLASKRRRRGR